MCIKYKRLGFSSKNKNPLLLEKQGIFYIIRYKLAYLSHQSGLSKVYVDGAGTFTFLLDSPDG